ncbi:hypothetical protein CE195_04565, partial [Sodalis-like symbiont of Philaenus spumarius]
GEFYLTDIIAMAWHEDRKINTVQPARLSINLGIVFFRKRQNVSRLFYNITALGYSCQQALGDDRLFLSLIKWPANVRSAKGISRL